MRIMMLAQFYAPIIGGEERLVQDLSTELVRRGHEVAVVTLLQTGLAVYEVDQGVRVYRIPSTIHRAKWLFTDPGRRYAPPWPDPETMWALRRVMAREQPEIVHAHNWLLYSFLPIRPWITSGLVMTLHDHSLACAQKRFMHLGSPCSGPGFMKCLACASDHYGPMKGLPTTFSNWMMGVAERAGVDMFLPVSDAVAIGNGLVGSGLPYQVIPNFVPDIIGAPRDVPDSRLAQLPHGDFLLFVGDLLRDKGIDILLRAYAGLTNAPPLVLIGEKGFDAPAEFPANVLFLGKWPHDAVMEAWRRSTIALIPSVLQEAFGLVAIEAMVCGRPVIASRTGGLSDIIVDGETGLLVPPGDPILLRQAIERLLASAGLRERMGQAGQRRVAEFRASTVVPRIEEVYQAVLA